jgi:hypothetical protein
MLFPVQEEDRAPAYGSVLPASSRIRSGSTILASLNHRELAVAHIPQFRATCESEIAVGTQSLNGTCGVSRRVHQITG